MTRIVFTLATVLISVVLVSAQAVRSVDGTFNNVFNPEWGAEGHELSAITSNGFSDGISAMNGMNRPNPRYISNHMFSQADAIFDKYNLSDFVWVFGQFIDHDISLVESDPTEPLFIPIPDGDKVFTPGGAPMAMFRSAAMAGTGTAPENPRKYVNSITAFVDASSVYGSDERRASWLRTYTDGKLKTSEGNLLPWNTTTGEFNAPKDPSAPFMADDTRSGTKLFVAGDLRANENPLLLAMHTIFVREHNRLCDEIKNQNPDLADEEIYQKARLWVGAYLQSILYNEWLPAMGVTLPTYRGYRPEVNPQISNVFSAAAFRMGHTLISSNILRLQTDGEEIPSGHISLRDAFFNPIAVSLAGGIEPYLRGMASQVQQKLDCKVIDDVRNFLFGPPSQGGLDLAAININRGRERGLPDYNTIRSDIGLPRLKSLSEVTSDTRVQKELTELYGSIDNIDPWVGMLAEDYMPGAIMGSTIMHIVERQFQVLRDGDRYYYEADKRLSREELEEIRNTTMRDIIMRNTDIEIMQKNVFKAMPRELIERGPEVEKISLSAALYPNPSNGVFEVKVYAADGYDLSMTIFDLQGRIVSRTVHRMETGDNFIPVNIADTYDGAVYHLLLEKGQLEYKILRVIVN